MTLFAWLIVLDGKYGILPLLARGMYPGCWILPVLVAMPLCAIFQKEALAALCASALMAIPVFEVELLNYLSRYVDVWAFPRPARLIVLLALVIVGGRFAFSMRVSLWVKLAYFLAGGYIQAVELNGAFAIGYKVPGFW